MLFTFPIIVSYSALGIGLYLFTERKLFSIKKKKRKKMIGHHTRLRENDNLPLWP